MASQTHLTSLTWEDKASGILEVSQGFFALETAVGAAHLFSLSCNQHVAYGGSDILLLNHVIAP